jgi:hypothetical protein
MCDTHLIYAITDNLLPFFPIHFRRSCGPKAEIQAMCCHVLIRTELTVIEAASTIKPVTIRSCILGIY